MNQLAELFLTFAKIGLFTFGGGYAMIANIREVVTEQKKWLDEEELVQVIAVAESTPGPIAINLATYAGYKLRGIPGSLAATCGVIVPSLAIIYTISLFLDAFMANTIVASAFVGIKCAVAFLILKAGFDMFQKLEKKPIPMAVFFAVLASMLAMELLSIQLSSIVLILAGGLMGIALYGRKGAAK
jgi:chromate transporter